jgi:hypothetical protein
LLVRRKKEANEMTTKNKTSNPVKHAWYFETALPADVLEAQAKAKAAAKAEAAAKSDLKHSWYF